MSARRPRTKADILAEIEQIKQNKEAITKKYDDLLEKTNQRYNKKMLQIQSHYDKKRTQIEKEATDAKQQHDSNLEKLKTKWADVLNAN